MKIITVNLPVSDIKTIAKLVGPDGLYPSRSELIRVAVRTFLVKERHYHQNYSFKDILDKRLNKKKKAHNKFIPSTTVDVPYEKEINGHIVTEIKTFKIKNIPR